MTTFADLMHIAYKAELAASRRLAKHTDMPDEAALRQILQKSAGNRTLEDLYDARLQIQQKIRNAHEQRLSHKANKLASRTAMQQADSTAWHAWFDGATSPNPGRMGIGGLLRGPAGQQMEISHAAGHGDSNQAEYLALIAVLEAAHTAQAIKLLVHGDSRVVIDDVTKTDEDGAASLQTYRKQAQALLTRLPNVSLAWLPRAKNVAADALSQRAIEFREK